MIDSVIWKGKLKQDLRSLEKRLDQKRWSYRSFVLFERELILIFFAIRRLIESGKITDRIAQKQYSCNTYPNLGKIVDELSKYDLDEGFDFEAEEEKTLSLRFLTNQFVHAYVIYPDFSEDGEVIGVLLCSDWEKHNSLIQVKTEAVISIIKDVVNDEIHSMHIERDPKTGEFRKTEIK
jgi:hypothetical protein